MTWASALLPRGFQHPALPLRCCSTLNKASRPSDDRGPLPPEGTKTVNGISKYHIINVLVLCVSLHKNKPMLTLLFSERMSWGYNSTLTADNPIHSKPNTRVGKCPTHQVLDLNRHGSCSITFNRLSWALSLARNWEDFHPQQMSLFQRFSRSEGVKRICTSYNFQFTQSNTNAVALSHVWHTVYGSCAVLPWGVWSGNGWLLPSCGH